MTPTCKVCGKETKIFASSGRAKYFCGPKCASTAGGRASLARKMKPCEKCGTPVHSTSKRCVKCYNGGQVKRPMSTCQGCGIQFRRKKGGNAGKYHSRECSFAHNGHLLPRIIKRLVKKWPADESWWNAGTIINSCDECGTLFRSKHRGHSMCSGECRMNRYAKAVLQARIDGRVHPDVMNCKRCGKAFVRVVDGKAIRRGTQCDECMALLLAATHKACKVRRKMRKYGHPITKHENIIEEDVFCSQLWRCGICGESVPHDKPANHPLSAELDHIKPLSKLGTHTKDNVQCTHRICNSIKSDMLQRDAILAVRAALKAYQCKSVTELAEKCGLKVKGKRYRMYPASKNPSDF